MSNRGFGFGVVAGAAPSTTTTGVYYGGNNNPPAYSTITNIVTRINVCGTLIGSETNVATGKACGGNAAIGDNAVYYGGGGSICGRQAIRINKCGTQVGSTTTPGSSPSTAQGKTASFSTTGIYWTNSGICSTYNKMVSLNACGNLVGCSSPSGCGLITCGRPIYGGRMAKAENFAIFGTGYRCFGTDDYCCQVYITQFYKFNSCRNLVGSVCVASSYTTRLQNGAAAKNGSNAMFYAGVCESSKNYSNSTVRISACLAFIGSQTNVGTARNNLGGADIGTNSVFYGGIASGSSLLNTVTRINQCAALVGSQTTAGTARLRPFGAGI
jgi:hypothetical protein